MASSGPMASAPAPGPDAVRARLRGLRAQGPAAPIGLGLAALGRPGYINLGHGDDLGADRSPEAMERGAHAVLDAALSLGVRYLDAARSYGRAEDFLGSWLTARARPGRPGRLASGATSTPPAGGSTPIRPR